jgi:4-carboxymuconolactone decarboxylase
MWGKIIAALGVCYLLGGAGSVAAQTRSALPADINPETYSRIRALSRDELDAEGEAAWDLVVGDGPKPTTGPTAVTMYSPKVAEAFQILNQYLRFGSELTPRQFEVAIMAATWEIEQQYEWSAHEQGAVRAGVPREVIDAIKYDRALDGLGAEDTLIIEVARALLRDHELDSALYAQAVAHFGQRNFLDLVTIMGDYIMAGLLLTAIDQHQPPDRPALLPER